MKSDQRVKSIQSAIERDRMLFWRNNPDHEHEWMTLPDVSAYSHICPDCGESWMQGEPEPKGMPSTMKHPLIRSIVDVASDIPASGELDPRDLERLRALATILQRHSCGVIKAAQEIEKIAEKWSDAA